jgi:hypothetical protein
VIVFKNRLFFFRNNSALLTTDPKDIETNNKLKFDMDNFESALLNYKKYVVSKIDGDILKVNYSIKKYHVIYDKITALLTKINKDIYEVYYKDKIPKTNIFCTICLTNASTHVSVPCGHIFCGDCITKMNSNCASCRTQIEKTIKLYNLDAVNGDTGETLQDNTAQSQSNST